MNNYTRRNMAGSFRKPIIKCPRCGNSSTRGGTCDVCGLSRGKNSIVIRRCMKCKKMTGWDMICHCGGISEAVVAHTSLLTLEEIELAAIFAKNKDIPILQKELARRGIESKEVQDIVSNRVCAKLAAKVRTL